MSMAVCGEEGEAERKRELQYSVCTSDASDDDTMVPKSLPKDVIEAVGEVKKCEVRAAAGGVISTGVREREGIYSRMEDGEWRRDNAILRTDKKQRSKKSIGQYELGRNETDAACIQSVNVACKSNENSETRDKKPEGARVESSE